MNIKRILLINGEFPPISGGGGVYTLNLAKGIAENYPHINVVVLAGMRESSLSKSEENIYHNLKIVRIPDLHLIDKGETHIWKIVEIIKNAIITFNPDIVHTHHIYESLGALICKYLLNFKLIITIQKSPVTSFHHWQSDPQWFLIRYIYI